MWRELCATDRLGKHFEAQFFQQKTQIANPIRLRQLCPLDPIEPFIKWRQLSDFIEVLWDMSGQILQPPQQPLKIALHQL